jgi:hypothetical protein
MTSQTERLKDLSESGERIRRRDMDAPPVSCWYSPLDTAKLKPKSISPTGGDALRLAQSR